MQKLLTADPSHPGRGHTVDLLDHFRHHGPNGTHVCMVFELLGENLLGLIRRYQHRGVPAHIVRQISKQVLFGLDYMHRKCGIIHTDLKPENVLICINDVERVVQAELDSTPSAVPTRIVGVPPSQGRGGHQTPRRDSIMLTGSQPLASPSSSLAMSISHIDKWSFGMSKIDGARSSVSTGDDPLSQSLSQMSTEEIMMSPSINAPMLHPATSREALSDSSPSLASFGSHSVSSAMSTEGTSAHTSANYQPAPAAGDPGLLPPPPPYDPSSLDRITVKIADFGNACWTDKHFTDDIQTRQYRAPEVIIGSPWDASADVWSAACLIFELMTGDYLFEPSSGAQFDKNDDHLAQMIELLGPLSKDISLAGKWSHEMFDRNGDLLHIHRLRYWPLIQVLQDKYLIPFQESNELSSFLLPMLRFDRFKRASARDCLLHQWLQGVLIQGEIEMMQRKERLFATHAHINTLGFRRESAAALADPLKPIDYFSSRASQAHISPFVSSPLATTQVTTDAVLHDFDTGHSPTQPVYSALPPLPEATQEHSGITIKGEPTARTEFQASSIPITEPQDGDSPLASAPGKQPSSTGVHGTPTELNSLSARPCSPSPHNLSPHGVYAVGI